ncbi:hypothetical protein EES41_06715 [Streptomyces sp. ADI95-16]|nr:hypothetical protein EES41_06715 [Streptomyces sp. ADI95-16]
MKTEATSSFGSTFRSRSRALAKALMPKTKGRRARVRATSGGPRSSAVGAGAASASDDLRDGQRVGDRPVLRDQLAHDHQHDGGERYTQQRRGGGDSPGGQADGLEGAAQQRGDGRLGQHADDQRGHRDAELGTRELEGQALGCLQDALGAPLTGGGSALELTAAALDGGQRELGGDEHRARQRQRQNEKQEQDFGHRATSARRLCICGLGMARLGLGGSPICGSTAPSSLGGPRVSGPASGCLVGKRVPGTIVKGQQRQHLGWPTSPDGALSGLSPAISRDAALSHPSCPYASTAV